MNQNKMQYNVSLTLIVKDKLTYEESEKLAEELREKYLGKEVDLDLSPSSTENSMLPHI